MKKIILISALALCGGASQSFAQGNLLNSVTKAAGAVKTVQKISNVAATAKEISAVLGNTLGLSKLQNTKLVSLFTKHINGTNGIASLAQSNMGTYASKLLGINTGTLSSLKTILTVSQYTKLLGLGGQSGSSTAGTLLKSLSGGSNLSSGATSVLSSLLLK